MTLYIIIKSTVNYLTYGIDFLINNCFIPASVHHESSRSEAKAVKKRKHPLRKCRTSNLRHSSRVLARFADRTKANVRLVSSV